MAGFHDPSPFILRSHHYLPFSVRASPRHLAGTNRQVVQNAILRSEVLETLSPNDAALVLRRTSWILMESRIVVELVVFERCQSHVSRFSPFNNSKFTRTRSITKLRALNGMGDILSWGGGVI